MQRDRLDYLSEQWHARRPDIDITPWGIWGRTTRLHELFLGAISETLSRHGLNFKEFQTLGALVLAGPPYEVRANEIARFNLLTSGGLANLLSRMEKYGFLERKPDTRDKRGVIVRITEKGLSAFNAAVVAENRIEHDLVRALTAEEREVLALLLRKLLRSIDPDALPAQEPATESTTVPAPARVPAAAAATAPAVLSSRPRRRPSRKR